MRAGPFEVSVIEEHGETAVQLQYLPADLSPCISYYIFASKNGITQEQAEILGNMLEKRCIGSPRFQANLCYLGYRETVCELGDFKRYGTKEEQVESLRKIIKELPSVIGTYGSFWRETFSLLRNHPASKKPVPPRITIYYFTENPAVPPMEWQEKKFEKWLNQLRQRQRRTTPDNQFTFTFVSALKNIKPFYLEYQVVDFDEFLDELMSLLPEQEMQKEEKGPFDVTLTVDFKNSDIAYTLSFIKEGWEYEPGEGDLEFTRKKLVVDDPSVKTEWVVCRFSGISPDDIKTICICCN